MRWSEGAIARAIALQTLARKCLVLVDNCNWTGSECDVLGVTTDLRIIDVEIKISRSDLKADAKKDKWWHRSWDNRAGLKLDWPRKVWKHYYALPAEIWDDKLLECLPSDKSGVLLMRLQHNGVIAAHCHRRATPNREAARLTPAQAVDIARLANLRMWDAYQRVGFGLAPAQL